MATREETVIDWLRMNLGASAMGALTGTDIRCLKAATAIIEAYAYTYDTDLLEAFDTVVLKMQPSTREFAYHAIAYAMDWDDRKRVWSRTGLDPIAMPTLCKGQR